MKTYCLCLFLFLGFFLHVFAERNLFEDLRLVDQVNCEVNDSMPMIYNHLLYGGYINMPSARMPQEGVMGFGYAYVPPYRIYSLHCQLLHRLEVSGNYRVFSGIDDPLLTPRGFGDFSDKGINVKVAILRPEDSDYRLPGVAIGFDDFLGTRNFKSKYLVATQVFLKYNLEFSLGIGAQRIRRWFGGAAWIPFRQSCNRYLQGITLLAD